MSYILSSDVDVQLLHQCFGDRPEGLMTSGFPFFASRLSSILFTRFLYACFLILARLTTS